MQALSQIGRRERRAHMFVPMPPRLIEYAYYVSVAYAVMAEVFSLSVPLLAGGMILCLAAYCILHLQSRARAVYEPIAWLLACAVSFLVVQISIHGESLADPSIRAVITWILGLIVVHSLSLRPGFSRRFPLVLFVIGAVTLPYVSFVPGEVERARVDLQVGGSLTHTSGLAEWFGFCVVYFAIVGLGSKSTLFRLGAWAAAVGCLFVVTLTVSRTVLVATSLATIVGFRGFLRRGFWPLLIVIGLVGIVYESGLFEQAAVHYSERGLEETGRERLWPAAVERIATSPLVGVGISNVGMSILSADKVSPPHNSFLWFALSSGVVPLAFYCAFWIRAIKAAFSRSRESPDEAFRIPYLSYVFVAVMAGDTGFMSFWGLLAFSVGAGPSLFHSTRRRVAVPGASPRMAQLMARRPRSANALARHRF